MFRPDALTALVAHTTKRRVSTPLDQAEIEMEGVLRFARRLPFAGRRTGAARSTRTHLAVWGVCANEILRKASAFFAQAERDRRQK